MHFVKLIDSFFFFNTQICQNMNFIIYQVSCNRNFFLFFFEAIFVTGYQDLLSVEKSVVSGIKWLCNLDKSRNDPHFLRLVNSLRPSPRVNISMWQLWTSSYLMPSGGNLVHHRKAPTRVSLFYKLNQLLPWCDKLLSNITFSLK